MSQTDAGQDNKNQIQASIDVCVNICKFMNLTPNKMGPIAFSVKVFISDIFGIPYQLIPTQNNYQSQFQSQHQSNSTIKKEQSFSNIDMESYCSQFFSIKPYDQALIREIIVFKLHVPLQLIQKNKEQLKISISFLTKNQLFVPEYEKKSEQISLYKCLAQQIISINQILYADTFIPCLFNRYGAGIQGNVKTHLLSFRYKNLQNVYRHQLYQAIDHMIISYNKLSQKISSLRKKSELTSIKSKESLQYFEPIMSQRSNLNEDQYKLQSSQLPSFICVSNYPQFQQIRQFIQNRIFKQQTMKQHKILLNNFVYRFIPQMSEKLLIIWKHYLKLLIKERQQIFSDIKSDYLQNLAIQLKNRIEYRTKHNRFLEKHMNRQYSNFKNRISHIGHHDNSKLTLVSQRSSSLNNYRNNKSTINSINFLDYSINENTPTNNLNQSFYQSNIYQTLRRINVLNIDRKYPLLKVIVEKQLGQVSFNQISSFDGNISLSDDQPHVIVLVHGLGANSTAFDYYQSCLNYFINQNDSFKQNGYIKRLLILNSVSNEEFANQHIDDISKRLVFQIQQFIHQNKLNFIKSFKLSFIGHSLGGLIVRNALPMLNKYKFNMKTLITMSTPHLGYFYHNSKFNKIGMWTLQKFFQNKIMRLLLMKDGQDYNEHNLNNVGYQKNQYRQTFMYKLSLMQGLGWFEDVVLCGSVEDYFVSPISAQISSNMQIVQECCDPDELNQEGGYKLANSKPQYRNQNAGKAQIWQQMRINLLQQISNSAQKTNLHRLTVKFSEQAFALSNSTLKEYILGKKAHVEYLSDIDFIQYLIISNKKWFS